MIEVKKLDGSAMYLNEDLIGRVEYAASGQSAVHLLDGGHVIVANDPLVVVGLIRAEKVALLRRVLQGPEATLPPPETEHSVTRLSEVRGQ
ncbi:MAG TPA: flagellar FlbD family protein [Acidimicrobiales bacterium]|nr:flagellar FlbD family protein [Acidimicrobiales bacterium]